MFVLVILGVIIAAVGQVVFWRYSSIGDGNNVSPIGLVMTLAGVLIYLVGVS